MRFPSILSALVLALALASPLAAAVNLAFPPGVTWETATPEQIREAVFSAVKKNPDGAVDIVTSAIESVAKTGRYPSSGAADGKQTLDPEAVTFEEVSDQIGQAAIQANPALAAQILQAVSSSVASNAAVAAAAAAGSSGGADGGGSGGGTGGGGGGAPALPGGFGGGGGGGSGGGTIYSN